MRAHYFTAVADGEKLYLSPIPYASPLTPYITTVCLIQHMMS